MTEMPIALAATYDPRGEIPRLIRFYPLLQEVYDPIVIVLPPHAAPEDRAALAALPGAQVASSDPWAEGRFLALEMALAGMVPAPEGTPPALHYNDLDRLLRWVETRPEEWRAVVERVRTTDCLIVGRTPAAYATHPQALIQTEAIANGLVGRLLGRTIDLSAGSKGFSRRAAQTLLQHARRDRAMGADAEWPLLLQAAGFRVEYVEVDGLDWETADRYRPTAADAETQRALAAQLDADPQQWAWRVTVLREIIESALEAARNPLVPTPEGESQD